jgi:threonine synthase
LKPGIKYYSTNLKAPHVTFKEALFKGLAPDGGLYMPDYVPELSVGELEVLSCESYPELAADILHRLIGDELGKNNIDSICRDIYTFDIPLETVYARNYLMRLDQGPTASFKDFAALFMGRVMQNFLNIDKQYITILTATSGDTGSAVANAFYGLKNIKVIILFPFSEVTDLQRKQMTTLRSNIKVIAVDGKFDDCQKLVKRAFMDPSVGKINLSSANSINIGRLLPQSVYYFWAWAQLSGKVEEQVIYSVPSGNFGNLAGGLIARRMGLPVKRFIISTNENDEVPAYFNTGKYKTISPSRNCMSSAMNVGHPSNLARLIAMYAGRMNEQGEILKEPDMARMKNELFAISVSDRQTIETIEVFYRKFKKLLEPHGAVAWFGLQEFLGSQSGNNDRDQISVCLETAHPAKFREEIKNILNIEPVLPESLQKIKSGNEDYISLENNYELFKKFILQNY